MKKVIHPCDVPTWNGRKFPMFCKIKFEDGRLSITGVIGPTVHGNAMGGCGQIDMEFDHANPEHNDSRYSEPVKASSLRFAPGWTSAKWYKFLEYWHDWHLNDTHSECEHQQALGWKYEDHHGVWLPDESAYEAMKFHKYLGEACPECGYRIGSARTMREVPAEVIEFLFSLPDTDRVPNWV
jgi:hypothetical protein